MKNQALLFRPLSGEQGMALVSALLLLLVVSLLGVGLSMDTSMDVRIAGYQRIMASSFGFGDAGIMIATDILEENAFEAGWNGPVPLTFPHLSSAYNGDIKIHNDGVFYMGKNPNLLNIIEMTGELQADIATQYLSSELAVGGAVQVAGGYGGTGKGTGGGGGHILYNLEGTGWVADQTSPRLGVNYRFVTK